MPLSREQRREERRAAAEASYGAAAQAALDVLGLLEWAWHDCYGDTVPGDVVDLVWRMGEGRLDRLVWAAHLAVLDLRDLRMAERR